MHSVQETRRGSRSSRRYGFSCLCCRRRKIRCDGKKPSCQNCQKSRDECVYKDTEAMILQVSSQFNQSQRRVQELEDQIKQLALATDEDRNRLLSEMSSQLPSRGEHDLSLNSSDADRTPSVLETPIELDPRDADILGDRCNQSHDFGEASIFLTVAHPHMVPHEEKEDKREKARQSAESESYTRWFQATSKVAKSWEKLAFANLSRDPDLDPEVSSTLLQLYWTWQAPLHNAVYRRCFFRDMALGGPYFSPFLLNCIYAQACRHAGSDDPRFCGFDRGNYFLAKARQLLLSEMSQERPRIPTIQGLLILGGRQCAMGKSSEGWLYTGMAFHMLKDLGLHLNARKLKLPENLDPDDLEARMRLYLSAYTWDKIISVTLGRPPSLTNMPYSPRCLLDHSDNDEPFLPLFLKETLPTNPPIKSYNTLTFITFCEMTQFINQSFNIIYNGRLNDLKSQAVLNLEKRLRAFHRAWPEPLQLENFESAVPSAPGHIYCINIIYHTILILLYRPFFLWAYHSHLRDHTLSTRAQTVCTEEAIHVNKLYERYGRAFNFGMQSYMISYCVYTAATIDVHQIQSNDDSVSSAAADRLALALQMLENAAQQAPVIKNSMDMLKAQLRRGPQAVVEGSRHTRWESSVAGVVEVHQNTVPTAVSDIWLNSTSQKERVTTMKTNLSSQLQHHFRNALNWWTVNAETGQATQYVETAMDPPQGQYTSIERENQHAFIDLHRPMPFQDLNVLDAGGGFVPSHENWTAQDLVSSFEHEFDDWDLTETAC